MDVYLFTLLLTSICNVIALSENAQSIICDNGEVNIEADLPPTGDLQCTSDRIVISEYLQPAGRSSCTDQTKLINGQPVCMDKPLSYDDSTIVTSGDYRPLPPQYGEYKYLPPQRWLHALKYGAVVFLYHPCAPIDQVMELKRLARTCLWKHVITPSDLLSINEPFALVSYGCSYSMKWIDRDKATSWIQAHALQTPESVVTQDGLYHHGLMEASYIISTPNDSVICPTENNNQQGEAELDDNMPPGTNGSYHGNGTVTTPTETTPTTHTNESSPQWVSTTSTDTNCSSINDDSFLCDKHSYIIVVLHNYPVLYGLIILLGVVALTLGLFLFCVYFSKRTSFGLCSFRSKKQTGRYKPCGQFYIGGKDGIATGIAIPELGLPKTVPSEREKLLIESDEDEL